MRVEGCYRCFVRAGAAEADEAVRADEDDALREVREARPSGVDD